MSNHNDNAVFSFTGKFASSSLFSHYTKRNGDRVADIIRDLYAAHLDNLPKLLIDTIPALYAMSTGITGLYTHVTDEIAIVDTGLPTMPIWLSIVCHELIHATGHKSRLSRPMMQFGYSEVESHEDEILTWIKPQEETTACIGTAILTRHFGIDTPDVRDSINGQIARDSAPLSDDQKRQAFKYAVDAARYLIPGIPAESLLVSPYTAISAANV